MRTQYTVAMSLLAGVALDGLAVQGLHAQAKLKAYSIGEIVPIAGATVSPGYLDAARKAIADAHGHSMGTLNGKIFYIGGRARFHEGSHDHVGQCRRRQGIFPVESLEGPCAGGREDCAVHR
jgi:hypothetical protein